MGTIFQIIFNRFYLQIIRTKVMSNLNYYEKLRCILRASMGPMWHNINVNSVIAIAWRTELLKANMNH